MKFLNYPENLILLKPTVIIPCSEVIEPRYYIRNESRCVVCVMETGVFLQVFFVFFRPLPAVETRPHKRPGKNDHLDLGRSGSRRFKHVPFAGFLTAVRLYTAYVCTSAFSIRRFRVEIPRRPCTRRHPVAVIYSCAAVRAAAVIHYTAQTMICARSPMFVRSLKPSWFAHGSIHRINSIL